MVVPRSILAHADLTVNVAVLVYKLSFSVKIVFTLPSNVFSIVALTLTFIKVSKILLHLFLSETVVLESFSVTVEVLHNIFTKFSSKEIIFKKTILRRCVQSSVHFYLYYKNYCDL